MYLLIGLAIIGLLSGLIYLAVTRNSPQQQQQQQTASSDAGDAYHYIPFIEGVQPAVRIG